MRRSSRVWAIVTIALTLTLLVGCAASAEAKSGEGNTVARYVALPDGDRVLCVFWVPVDSVGVATAEGAQISCDWGGAKE